MPSLGLVITKFCISVCVLLFIWIAINVVYLHLNHSLTLFQSHRGGGELVLMPSEVQYSAQKVCRVIFYKNTQLYGQ